MPPKLYFVTGNQKKLAEFRHFIERAGISLAVESVNLDLPEMQGDTRTVLIEKCRAASAAVPDGAVLVDDTSLEIQALNGLPGVYVKHFISSVGAEGIVKMLSAFPEKSCKAVCGLAYTEGPNADIEVILGECPAKIVEPRGGEGFGFDPIVEEENSGKTFAEMTFEEKNRLSHRAIALSKFCEFISTKK